MTKSVTVFVNVTGPMQHISINVLGHKLVALASNTHTSSTPVIFLHGIMASIHFWPSTLPQWLQNEVSWFSLSLPGHYPAVLPEEFQTTAVTMEMFGQLLSTAIQKLVGDQPVILVGHSTGGLAALILAAYMPEQIKQVICISGFCQGRWNGVIGLLQKLSRRGKLGCLLFKRMLTFATRNRYFYRMTSALNAADRAAYFSSPYLEPTLDAMRLDAVHHNLDGLAHLFRGIANIDISSLLPKIKARVLVVAGDCDPIVPFTQAKILATQIPNAELRILPGVGHMFFAECTDEYHHILKDWIQPVSLENLS